VLIFKIWSSLIVNNGPDGGGGGEESRSGAGDNDELVSAYFERYGFNWQRIEDDRGFNGNYDRLPMEDMGSSAFYRFTIGLGGEYRVMAHIPAMTQAPSPAAYEAYVLD